MYINPVYSSMHVYKQKFKTMTSGLPVVEHTSATGFLKELFVYCWQHCSQRNGFSGWEGRCKAGEDVTELYSSVAAYASGAPSCINTCSSRDTATQDPHEGEVLLAQWGDIMPQAVCPQLPGAALAAEGLESQWRCAAMLMVRMQYQFRFPRYSQ